MSASRRRYAFVVPRFGEWVIGGAETLVAELARRLAERGDEVQVLATCARDNRSWSNDLPEGDGVERGVRVKRFAVDPRDLDRWVPLQIGISEGMRPTVDDQLVWMAESVNSAGLYRHIAEHGRRYDAIFFAPYLFGTTFWGALIHPERSFLIPCLHDEHCAYLDIFGSLFRQVRGGVFNAEPEHQLARSLYGDVKGGEVGMGFDFSKFDGDTFEPYFDRPFPYLLYAGRKETGKNVQVLVDHFIEGKEQGWIPAEIRLVIAGGGSFDDLHRPRALERSDVMDIGHLSEVDKLRLMKHALLFATLSRNESFSIVIMEAWLMGTPCVVHADCAVTRRAVTVSGGGLYCRSAAEFGAIVRTLHADPALRADLARAGDRYVRETYSWPAVLERFDTVMNGFFA